MLKIKIRRKKKKKNQCKSSSTTKKCLLMPGVKEVYDKRGRSEETNAGDGRKVEQKQRGNHKTRKLYTEIF